MVIYLFYNLYIKKYNFLIKVLKDIVISIYDIKHM
jgi:hypothetical protein